MLNKILKTIIRLYIRFISHIGGNLGLFTGMSVLSMFEILFWVARFVFGGASRRKRTQDQTNDSQIENQAWEVGWEGHTVPRKSQ